MWKNCLPAAIETLNRKWKVNNDDDRPPFMGSDVKVMKRVIDWQEWERGKTTMMYTNLSKASWIQSHFYLHTPSKNPEKIFKWKKKKKKKKCSAQKVPPTLPQSPPESRKPKQKLIEHHLVSTAAPQGNNNRVAARTKRERRTSRYGWSDFSSSSRLKPVTIVGIQSQT